MKSILNEIQSRKQLYCIVLLAAILLSTVIFTGIISYETNFAVGVLNTFFWSSAYVGAFIVSIIITFFRYDSKKLIPLSITILIPLFFFISIDIKIPYFLPISGALLLIAWFLIVILVNPPKTFALSFFLLLLFSYFGTLIGSLIMERNINIELEKAKATAQVVIDKIELYHQEHGTYPENIEDAGITDEMMKLDYPFSQLNYRGHGSYNSGNMYWLEFAHPLGIMNYWYYVPETKEWKLS